MAKFTEFDLEMAFRAGAEKVTDWDFDNTPFMEESFTKWLEDYVKDTECK